MRKTVVTVCAHMDDETLGLGGTIAKHVAQKDAVHVIFISDRAYGHSFDERTSLAERRCARAAAERLGYGAPVFLGLQKDELMDERLIDIIVPIEEKVKALAPDIAYIPHRGDPNQDHRAVFQACLVACRRVPRLLCYEVPSSTELAPPFPEYAFQPNFYVDISGTLKRKLSAMQAYRRELRRFPNARSLEGLKVYARRRGMESGFTAAEAFCLMRDRWG